MKDMKELISKAVKGEKDNPKALLLKAGVMSMQKRAGQSFTTDSPMPVPIEQYWHESPYSKKKYPVRFVARVVTDWINQYAGSYSISPEQRNELDNRIYKLLESAGE